MPLCFDAYWQDCSHLNDAEHGRYFLVMRALWMAPGQRLPNDVAWLARHFRRTPMEIEAQIKPILAEFCQCDGNWWTQNRLSREFARVAKTRQKQSARSKARWNKEKGECRGNAAAMPRESQRALKLDSESRTSSEDRFRSGVQNLTPTPEAKRTPDGVGKQPDLDALYYQRGKALLGQKAGGQLTKLRAACGDNVGAALQIIEDAQRKESPAEYVAGVIRSKRNGRRGNGHDHYAKRIYERHGYNEGEPEAPDRRSDLPLLEGREKDWGRH